MCRSPSVRNRIFLALRLTISIFTCSSNILISIAFLSTGNMSTQLSLPPDGNQNRRGPIIRMTVCALNLSCIFVGLRIYTRLFLTKSARWGDWTIVLALVLRAFLSIPSTYANLDEAWYHYRYWFRLSRSLLRICDGINTTLTNINSKSSRNTARANGFRLSSP